MTVIIWIAVFVILAIVAVVLIKGNGGTRMGQTWARLDKRLDEREREIEQRRNHQRNSRRAHIRSRNRRGL